jgi:TfoX/Sxy family transcriptional regulator of competence genes
MPERTPMPSFGKSPPDLVERFMEVVATRQAASVRKMFGYRAAFVNGNLATGLHEANWFVRVSESDAADLIAAGGGPFEPMPGRPMRGYAVLAPADAADPQTAGAWVDRAIEHVATLPPKK